MPDVKPVKKTEGNHAFCICHVDIPFAGALPYVFKKLNVKKALDGIHHIVLYTAKHQKTEILIIYPV